jgi:catechol 2,3-dioxygenase-like lactoylglutathione lyase family enzyme
MMKLGAFSISLNVKDLNVSKTFYETLGFRQSGGSIEQNYIIMKNSDHHTIGLYYGMFPTNILTFNPGWDQQCQTLMTSYDDVREIQKHLQMNHVAIDLVIPEENIKGPAHITFTDPDGNVILIDQHV